MTSHNHLNIADQLDIGYGLLNISDDSLPVPDEDQRELPEGMHRTRVVSPKGRSYRPTFDELIEGAYCAGLIRPQSVLYCAVPEGRTAQRGGLTFVNKKNKFI